MAKILLLKIKKWLSLVEKLSFYALKGRFSEDLSLLKKGGPVDLFFIVCLVPVFFGLNRTALKLGEEFV